MTSLLFDTKLFNTEAARIAALGECNILDTPPEKAFDDITRLAAYICGTPIALISLVDASRQWFKSKVGLDVAETNRDIAFCDHTIKQGELLIVPDTLTDRRFATNPLVTCEPYIRFYAGVPLLTPEGHALGTLCVIDYVAREMTSGQVEALSTLADQVSSQILLRRNLIELSRATYKRQQAEEALSQANAQLTNRVKELEQRNLEIMLLSEMSDFLQACLSVEEAKKVIAKLIPLLFPALDGGVLFKNPTNNLVEAVTTWGQPNSSQVLSTCECWALRRSRVHWLQDAHHGMLCQHFFTNPKPAQALCVPMLAQGETLGLLYLSSQEFGQFTDAKKRLARTVSEQIALALANIKLRENLRNQSIRDPLTSLYNRRYLEESLFRELNRAKRKQQPIGIVMLDVDHFKRFNDQFGHDAGDTVLKEVAKFLQKHTRQSDIACRYGGEEFILILPEASINALKERAEQIREGIKALLLIHDDQALGKITISLGIASFPEHGLIGDALIKAADTALYRAKAEGRDRVVSA
ncbi:MAG: diguanylate cyclase [Coleofasciculaceae cyanobacterium]